MIVSIALRLDDLNPVHARVSVWTGSAVAVPPGGIIRARAGELVLRTAEWQALSAMIDAAAWPQHTDRSTLHVEWYQEGEIPDGS